jgi:hypothetical protein
MHAPSPPTQTGRTPERGKKRCSLLFRTAGGICDWREGGQGARRLSCAKGGGTGGKAGAPTIPNPCPVLAARNGDARQGFVSRGAGVISMLMMKERRPATRTIEGWARCVLFEKRLQKLSNGKPLEK